MDRAVNFDQAMAEVISGLHAGAGKPLLLLHACCAPCSSAVLERLTDPFRLILLFDNPNLDTAQEYVRRSEEAKRLVRLTGWAERAVIVPYEPEAFAAAVRGHESEPEGGRRCEACFRLRLHRCAAAARRLGCAYFTTTLTVSPRKDASLLNRIGQEAATAAGVPFLPSDFKKRNGFLRSVELSRALALYRQEYCGCSFSRRKQGSTDRADD